MKQQKENWVKILFSFAGPCKGKMAFSVLCAILSVAGGFVPFWAVYKILLLFINQAAAWNDILSWCLIGVGGYLIRVICFGISTILAHISAYTILEGIRLKIANRLMKAPLGEVMGRRIGYLKNIIMDKVEDLEPPLAHMIPELTSNLLLPIAIFIWMLAIDWRLGLSILIAPILAMIPMFFLMKNYNSQYAAYMDANNHVNNIIIEYVEGIEVVKAFNQSTSSYEKFVSAVESFKEFTLAWFKSTWKSMNLMMAIMPTTLLGVLPIGLVLVRRSSITPAELAMGIILSLSIVGPLMKATTFINEAKSMEYAVEAANELLNLPVLPDSGKSVSISHTDIVLQDVSFSYDGTEQNEVLHGINLKMAQGSFTALVGPSGGGKSTIARLIARFWDVTGGSISIGGTNIKEYSIRQISELVSFVTQDNFLFNCSLKENIRLDNPNATDEEVYAAAKAACCDDFIARLEKGYDTPAGDAGKLHASGEDYLESILILQKKLGMVRSVDVARHMEVSKPSVCHALATLRNGGFLTMDGDRFLHLTDLGREVAERIYEKHCFFTEQLIAAGVAPTTAEADACRIEHIISDESFLRLKEVAAQEQDKTTNMPADFA